MEGTAGDSKGTRTAVCIGRTARGWAFIPTTSSWSAKWQTPIRQTGKGWDGWDLRYHRDTHWCPNMVMYLTEVEVLKELLLGNGKVGYAPADVVKHAVEEMRYAINNRLMSKNEWFGQLGMSRA